MSNTKKNHKDITGKYPAVFQFWKPLVVLVLLIVIGISLHYSGVLDWQTLLSRAENYTRYWWLPLLLILMQILLFTFALPGSAMLWVVAPLYPPTSATLILISGGTLGALGAIVFARRESTVWSQRFQNKPVYQLLEQRANLMTLLALRLAPGFPHSLINYGAGVLHIPLGRFILAATIGFGIKSFLYCNTIHAAISADELSELLQFTTLWPLLILSLVSAFAAVIISRHPHRH